MNVKRIDPIFGLSYILYGISDPSRIEQDRHDALTQQENNIKIDTCFCGDTEKYETGIKREGKWTIVEQYESRYLAKLGHDQWVVRIKANPSMELEDIDLWGIRNI